LAPGAHVRFIVACGPNLSGRPELDPASLAALFGGFRRRNASAVVCPISSLRDLAILATRCPVLSNDTGPGHLAAAAGAPVVTPYLPAIYPAHIWASTPNHRPVTLPPGTFSEEQVRNDILWGENRVISAIPVQALIDAAVGMLFPRTTHTESDKRPAVSER
jgi:ADP-heptose:LPS heptosyltransferase